MLKKLRPYLFWIAVTLTVAVLGGILTNGSMGNYEAANKSPLTPPSAVFPIVWSVLYLLMAISAGLITHSDASQEEKDKAIHLYALQLILNFFWSLIFFNMGLYFLSFLWLLALWILILVMIVQFSKINKWAAWLNVPYLLWVTFAGYLNFMIWMLNR